LTVVKAAPNYDDTAFRVPVDEEGGFFAKFSTGLDGKQPYSEVWDGRGVSSNGKDLKKRRPLGPAPSGVSEHGAKKGCNDLIKRNAVVLVEFTPTTWTMGEGAKKKNGCSFELLSISLLENALETPRKRRIVVYESD
jgi:hypothetical protein